MQAAQNLGLLTDHLRARLCGLTTGNQEDPDADGPAGLHIEVLTFSSAGPEQAKTGMLGWLSLTLSGQLLLDGVALRRTQSGRLRLSFPRPKSPSGREREVVRPIDDAARDAIEDQVLRALGIDSMQGLTSAEDPREGTQEREGSDLAGTAVRDEEADG